MTPRQSIAAAAFASAWALASSFSIISQAQESIPFDLTPDGHILVKAAINGTAGTFVFDTGAGLTVVTKRFADKVISLQKQDGIFTAFRATGERLTLDLFQGESLSMGQFTERNPVLSIIDADFGPLDGLISLMTFRQQPFTLDYDKKVLIFETAQSVQAIREKGKIIPLQRESSRDKSLDVFAYFRVNNKLTLQFSLDSGAGHGTFRVSAKHIQALGIDTAQARKTRHASEFNPAVKTTIYHAPLHSLAVRGQPTIQCQDVPTSFIEDLIYDGIISIDWIGRRITFDLVRDEMIVP